MFLIILTFLTALFVEGLGTLVSVKGAGSFFGGNPIILALVLALDIGKIVLVSFVYSHWKGIPWTMRIVGLPMIAIMMLFTSGSAAGFLSGEFQKAMVGSQEGQLKVQVLKEEQAKLEARKKQIDDQIANLPSNSARSRVVLMKQFSEEQKAVTERLNKLGPELSELQVSQISVSAKAGPILAVAEAFKISVAEAVKYVILMIILVFDPLAVFLIVAGNYLVDKRKAEKNKPPQLGSNEAVAGTTIVEHPPTLTPAELAVLDEPSSSLQEPAVISPWIPELATVEDEPAPSLFDNVQPEPEQAAVPAEVSYLNLQPNEEPSYLALELESLEPAAEAVVPVLDEPIRKNLADVQPREQITKSSLISVKADPNSSVDMEPPTRTRGSKRTTE